jgi:hypothetical protein
MLAKWFSSTRLETRTKESNVHASIRVIKTLMRNESERFLVNPKGRTLGFSKPGRTIDRPSLAIGLSLSMSVGTRKMVIYA